MVDPNVHTDNTHQNNTIICEGGQFCFLSKECLVYGKCGGAFNIRLHERVHPSTCDSNSTLIDRIVKTVLTPIEIDRLEASGMIMEFGKLDKVELTKIFRVRSMEIQLANEEHRLSVCLLNLAEYAGRGGGLQIGKNNDGSCIRTAQVSVHVCCTCFLVYSVLAKTRELLNCSTPDSTKISEVNNPSLRLRSKGSVVKSKGGFDIVPEQSMVPAKAHDKIKKQEEVKDKPSIDDNNTKSLLLPQPPSIVQESDAKAKILVVDSDKDFLVKSCIYLQSCGYFVVTAISKAACLSKLRSHNFDVLLLDASLPFNGTFEVIKWLRLKEKTKYEGNLLERLPILLMTMRSSWYQSFRGEVNGIISKPFSCKSLISAVYRVLSKPLKKSVDPPRRIKPSQVASMDPKSDQSKESSKIIQRGLMSTEDLVNELLPSFLKADTRRVTSKFIFNENINIPYTVLNRSNNVCMDKTGRHSKKSCFFNLVVCHDLFETQERFEMLLKPIYKKYDAIQVLLWNYPGQAYSTFGENDVLNNSFLSKCLSGLLCHVGKSGKNEFNDRIPFYMLGIGYGGSVALHFASTYRCPNLRAVVLVNGLSFVDSHFASILHDCRNVFSCTPSSRPDLPVYFYARYLFSKKYLKKATPQVALNLYTAVNNPISLDGRIKICDGALNTIDVRSLLENIFVPIICMYGTCSNVIKPIHAEEILNQRGGQNSKTIHQALKGSKKETFILPIDGGYELVQERKNDLLLIIEQLLTGYHETHDGEYLCSVGEEVTEATDSMTNKTTYQVENRFIDTIMNNIHKEAPNFVDYSPKEKSWGDRSKLKMMKEVERKSVNKVYTESPKKSLTQTKMLPIEQEVKRYTDVREYMEWRSIRNKKRLILLEKSALAIQRAFRAYLARTILHLAKRQAATLLVQKIYRGALGRRICRAKMKELWGSQLTQRMIRGFIGRTKVMKRRRQISAQIAIARIWRGVGARIFVQNLVSSRCQAAVSIQCFFRSIKAHRDIMYLKRLRDASICIQRLCRGYLGKFRAQKERDKFIFVKSQSRGIEIGRQLLLEHKLNATRLQSEVSVLNQQKIAYEQTIDSLLGEICQFEDAVQTLETEMQLVTQREAEVAPKITRELRVELREHKMRLDKNFTGTLRKIASRRESLLGTEKKLDSLEKELLVKAQQLKDLERKLVVLLEAQQSELDHIKRKQEESRQSEGFCSGKKSSHRTDDSLTVTEGTYTGPSVEEKQQAAQLMSSTESLMKFGFMSMSMSYFSSMNMIRAMRKVSAQDTVLAAVAGIKENKLTETKEPISSDEPISNANSQGIISKYQRVKSEPFRNWSVGDVIEWLESLCLGQYGPCFKDGAIDGNFLFALTDHDLKHTLGVEHSIHRKKILFNIEQLRSGLSEDVGVPFVTQPSATEEDSSSKPIKNSKMSIHPTIVDDSHGTSANEVNAEVQKMVVGSSEKEPLSELPSISDLFSFTRHQKYDNLRASLQALPNKKFVPRDIRCQFVENYGTAYQDADNMNNFHLNKVDEYGNTMLHIAAQNGNLRIAKMLILKGANPNHQNKQGQTPGHFAISYQFFDFGSWLFDPSGGGANDLLPNIYGLGPYDGLSLEGD